MQTAISAYSIWIQSQVLGIKLELLTFIQSVSRLALRLNQNSNKFLKLQELASNFSHFTCLQHLDFQAAVVSLDDSGVKYLSLAFSKKLTVLLLDLVNNKIGDIGAARLALAF